MIAARPRRPPSRRPTSSAGPDHGRGERRAGSRTVTVGVMRGRPRHDLVGARGRPRPPPIAATSSTRPAVSCRSRTTASPFADPTTDTGRRVNLARESMPANASGRARRPDGVEPQRRLQPRLRRSSRWCPVSTSRATGVAPITDIGRSLDADQPIVLLDADTGERQPVLRRARRAGRSRRGRDADRPTGAQPRRGSPLRRRAARPAGRRRCDDPRRHVRSSSTATASRRSAPAIESRRAAHGGRVRARSGARVSAGDDLYLAWDFTVASERNLSERMLHIRDDAFASLIGDARAGVPRHRGRERRRRPHLPARHRAPSPCRTTSPVPARPAPASTTVPTASRPATATSTPGSSATSRDRRAPTGPRPCTPTRAAVYGHGLLGSNDEVNAGNVRSMANEHNIAFCATKWAGFSEDDVGVAVARARRTGRTFPQVADRTQQGFLNVLFLARLLHTPDGLRLRSRLPGPTVTPLVDTSDVFYDGNSQGGILGGAVTAVSTEWTRAVLGVPGMNYSTLLQRSVDFDTYKAIMIPSYPNELDRMLVVRRSCRCCGTGPRRTATPQHMTDDPVPGHARAHRAPPRGVRRPSGRERDDRDRGPHDRRAPAGAGPRAGSRHRGRAVLGDPDDRPASRSTARRWSMWDSGTPAPPTANVPPRPPTFGDDPHEDPRNTPAARDAEVGVPPHRRRGDRGVRWRSLLDCGAPVAATRRERDLMEISCGIPPGPRRRRARARRRGARLRAGVALRLARAVPRRVGLAGARSPRRRRASGSVPRCSCPSLRHVIVQANAIATVAGARARVASSSRSAPGSPGA